MTVRTTTSYKVKIPAKSLLMLTYCRSWELEMRFGGQMRCRAGTYALGLAMGFTLNLIQ